MIGHHHHYLPPSLCVVCLMFAITLDGTFRALRDVQRNVQIIGDCSETGAHRRNYTMSVPSGRVCLFRYLTKTY